MITIYVTKEKDYIKEIKLLGHVSFSNPGQDIVCSAISSITFYTINAINAFGKSKSVNVEINNQKTEIKLGVIDLKDEIVSTFMLLLKEHLNDIAIQYPKNVKIKEK